MNDRKRRENMRTKKAFLLAVIFLLVLCSAPVSAASYKISKKSVTLYMPGQTKTRLSVKGGSKKARNWSSSKKSVATVSANGTVTARKPGKTIISVRCGKQKLTCSVTVKRALKKVKTGYVYNKKTPGGIGKDSTSLIVLKVSGNRIKFLFTFMSASGRMVDTNVITARISGNKVSAFRWKDSNGKTGTGTLSFGQKKVTIRMKSAGYYLWPTKAVFRFQKTLGKEEIRRLSEGWL